MSETTRCSYLYVERHWQCGRRTRHELEAEVARLRESEPLTYRGQRDAALAEVARLETLIVSWHNADGAAYLTLVDEAERIERSRR